MLTSIGWVFFGWLIINAFNPSEPPWYGPVCLVVWEGKAREGFPYPECAPGRPEAASYPQGPLGQVPTVSRPIGDQNFKCLRLGVVSFFKTTLTQGSWLRIATLGTFRRATLGRSDVRPSDVPTCDPRTFRRATLGRSDVSTCDVFLTSDVHRPWTRSFVPDLKRTSILFPGRTCWTIPVPRLWCSTTSLASKRSVIE